MKAYVSGASDLTYDRLKRQSGAVGMMARLDLVSDQPADANVQVIVDEATYNLVIGDAIDLDAERTRITKALETVIKERDALDSRLKNPAFVEKAKPEAVEKARADHAEKAAEAERLTAALARLG